MSVQIRRIVIAVVATVSTAATASADVIYMKDGFTLHGKVRREADLIFDPATGAMIPITKSGAYFILDDRVRFVIFSPRQVQDADPQVNIRSDFINLDHPNQTFSQDGRLPKKGIVQLIEPFDTKWTRKLKLVGFNPEVQALADKLTVEQRLRSLSPYATLVHSQRYPWAMTYMTQELGLDNVKKLLDTHTDTADGDAPDVDRRLKRVRFLLQGGWTLAASEELDRAVKDLPKEKAITDRTDRMRTAVRQTQVRELWEEIKLAHRAGRHMQVRSFLGRLPLDELDQRTAAEAGALQAKYATWDRQALELQRLLDVVSDRAFGPPRRTFADAEDVIRTQAGPDTLERLEPFLTIAGQFERDVKAGKTPTESAGDIFALAVTGWVMGSAAAEPKVAAAERLWAGRQFVLEHQRTHDAAARRRLFETYQQKEPLGLDEITQVISLAPPAETPTPGPKVATGVEDRTTDVPWTQNGRIPYVLQLPQEYQPTRTYPVLIALHAAGQKPLDALAGWSTEANRHGYILAAPAWGGAGGGYNYSAEEHNGVTELVKDLRRRYAVDSDRVFLAGFSEGATAAFDIALSHPDLFAGVVPINGRPKVASLTWYQRNAQYLPFYLVCGEAADGPYGGVNWVNDRTVAYAHQRTLVLNRHPFEQWMAHGYPSLLTIYKGRPNEFFGCEAPTIFDWMDRKRRQPGFPQLGRNPNTGSAGEEFQSARPGDNHFYWLSIEQIHDKYVNEHFGSRSGTAAALQAQARDNNQIFINCRGIKTLRAWFGRIWDPQTGWKPMIDFARPVTVTVNGRQQIRNKVVQPSLHTMLDDLYQRGDRQRMFVAYVDLTNLQ